MNETKPTPKEGLQAAAQCLGIMIEELRRYQQGLIGIRMVPFPEENFRILLARASKTMEALAEILSAGDAIDGLLMRQVRPLFETVRRAMGPSPTISGVTNEKAVAPQFQEEEPERACVWVKRSEFPERAFEAVVSNDVSLPEDNSYVLHEVFEGPTARDRAEFIAGKFNNDAKALFSRRERADQQITAWEKEQAKKQPTSDVVAVDQETVDAVARAMTEPSKWAYVFVRRTSHGLLAFPCLTRDPPNIDASVLCSTMYGDNAWKDADRFAKAITDGTIPEDRRLIIEATIDEMEQRRKAREKPHPSETAPEEAFVYVRRTNPGCPRKYSTTVRRTQIPETDNAEWTLHERLFGRGCISDATAIAADIEDGKAGGGRYTEIESQIAQTESIFQKNPKITETLTESDFPTLGPAIKGDLSES